MLTLRDDYIIETIARLQRRISERFPNSGLCHLCGELLDTARRASERSLAIGRPNVWIRGFGYLLTLALIALLVTTVWLIVLPSKANVDLNREGLSFADFLQTIEAGTNEVILLGASIYFLISLETRIKRRRALAAIHELRAFCHIIDMHQLTKDPERTLRNWKSTANSPTQAMTSLELNRYLDYCSEMLSLVGKIAALYVKQFDDAASVAAVSEVEQLSNGLSRKIWQKIMILHQARDSNHSPIPVVAPLPNRPETPDA